MKDIFENVRRHISRTGENVIHVLFAGSPLFHNLRQLVEPVTRLRNRVHPIPELRKDNSVNSLLTYDIKIR